MGWRLKKEGKIYVVKGAGGAHWRARGRQNYVLTTIMQNSWIEDFTAKRRFATVQYFQFNTTHPCKNKNWE